MNFFRFFSSAGRIASSELAQLRKKTGFTLLNCRKALQMFDNDVNKAEEWLRAEATRLGWEKALKLQNRTALEGVVAVARTEDRLVMAEVNCETDFVARNEKFVSLAEVVAQACLKHSETHASVNEKLIINSEELSNLISPNEEKLSDYTAKAIGELGENIILRRALYYKADRNIEIDVCVHPPISQPKEVQTGKYGAFVALQKKESGSSAPKEDLGEKLCKHIIGLNPKKVGSMEEMKSMKSEEEKKQVSSNEDENSDEYDEEGNHWEKEENELVKQYFLFDSEKTVGDILNDRGIKIIDFHRLMCGEDVEVISNEGPENDSDENIKVRNIESN